MVTKTYQHKGEFVTHSLFLTGINANLVSPRNHVPTIVQNFGVRNQHTVESVHQVELAENEKHTSKTSYSTYGAWGPELI
jgi:hypothetical protein